MNYYSGPYPVFVLSFYVDAVDRTYVRGDYKEVLNLALTYLGHNNAPLKMLRPGAISRARWMAKILYAIKITLLRKILVDNFPSMFSSAKLDLIEQFAKFCIFIYLPWWICATNANDAPINDFELVRNSAQYADHDSTCSNAALDSLKNHLWYLSEELVSLALFSDKVQDSVKEKIASKLLQDKTS